MIPEQDIIARITPSAPRRFFALVIMGTLAMCLLSLAVMVPTLELGWRCFMLVIMLGVLWVARAIYVGGNNGLLLTADALYEIRGGLLCQTADIISVERGTFAFKPSNGFTLKTRTKGPRRWVPGLCWRMGRRIGVGGVTGASQSKAMAEAIAMMVADRA